MKSEAKVKTQLQNYRGYFVILAFGISIAIGITWKYRADMDEAHTNYRQEETFKAADVKDRVEHLFQTIYEGLYIMTSLPGVRMIDRHAKNFDYVSSLAVQQIYHNIANKVRLSEIYIVPLDFNPERIDPLTGDHEAPSIIFDELIVGRTGGSSEDEQSQNEIGKAVEEVELSEYRLIVKQLADMKDLYPAESSFSGLQLPAFSGEEVLTCDNSRFDPNQPDDKDRSGIVYSVPFYSFDGQLKGCICGILLSHAIRDQFGSGNCVLYNGNYDYFVEAYDFNKSGRTRGYIERLEPDPELFYSQLQPINIPDHNGGWYLWSSQPNEQFWSRGDVIIARQFSVLAYTACSVLTAGVMFGYFLDKKNRFHLECVNQELTLHQAMLEKSQKLIKRFSGNILSIREEEKRRLARDLHDMIGSLAISLHSSFTVTEAKISTSNQPEALAALRKARGTLDNSIKQLKEIAVSLRPLNLETIGLTGALREFCTEITQDTSLYIDFDVEVDDDNISEKHSIALYRIVQESLNNILKHSRAEEVLIELFDHDQLHLTIVDNGIGFDIEQLDNDDSEFKMGVRGMRERIESLGGEFSLSSEHGKGTTVHVVLYDENNGIEDTLNAP